MAKPSATNFTTSPASKGLFGMAGLIDLIKPFGWYSGIVGKSRNWADVTQRTIAEELKREVLIYHFSHRFRGS